MTEESQYPLVTFALFAYNQEKYIREAVLGALSQDYPRLQVILSDDGSIDSTFQQMRQVIEQYRGPHNVLLNQNKRNLGIGAHVNKIMSLARGEIVIVAAGDDFSLPNRTKRIVDAFESFGDSACSIWSRAEYVDEHGDIVGRKFPGNPDGYTPRSIIRNESPVIGATHAWRRGVFDFFGPLMNDVMFEDNAISFRSYLLGGIRYLNESLVRYRTHSQNITNYVKNDNIASLYAGASQRNRWALAGVAQRRRDLALAVTRGKVSVSHAQIMRGELASLERRIIRRLKAYDGFPAVPWRLMIHMLMDPEIAKVFVRAIRYRPL
ncbi:glycosyltransferase [Thermomonas fusca]|uniref:glycosyltransferase n=1 Tax=Thermomonas fusca TaxID=215690 RepID=UPI00146E762D|nr:glycosyltransferase [Thermomonas fusca]